MSDLFPKLEPPPGGLARLRARLDAADRGRRVRRWVLAAASALVAIATVVNTVSHRPPPAVTLALLTAPREPVVARDGSTVEPVSASDAVVFYRVASLER